MARKSQPAAQWTPQFEDRAVVVTRPSVYIPADRVLIGFGGLALGLIPRHKSIDS